ncbi:TIGR04282 family arsenosugar biosynthesis glycosyltransferase [Cyclobacterium salsum]|uniref:TIGR04282 family arsenosugar biosynthesis glycosyltransferase n=1 Tax=Cyclobacterium salsum TaxID=2666329 RepID=UPI00139181D6|nr:TIGR04282 family arsenosugar biosynthesis glycosyltransferase [Cyclobacterium salsum]
MSFEFFALLWPVAMKKAIIVFQKYPEAGFVKTRLAKTIGAEKAANLYAFLIRHTHQQLAGLEAAIFVFHLGPIATENYPQKGYHFYPQGSGDLGKKMHQAFQRVFDLGFEQVLIIGTDCYELKRDHLQQAFEALKTKDLVLGPAVDGGYYLLGLKRPAAPLFQEISWSTATVLQQTLNRANQENLGYGLLEKLRDVDRYEDLGELEQLLPEL